MVDGEQLMSIQDHLKEQGWPRGIIDKDSKNVLKDEHMIDFINRLNEIENDN